jgi:hypothetical protein
MLKWLWSWTSGDAPVTEYLICGPARDLASDMRARDISKPMQARDLSTPMLARTVKPN